MAFKHKSGVMASFRTRSSGAAGSSAAGDGLKAGLEIDQEGVSTGCSLLKGRHAAAPLVVAGVLAALHAASNYTIGALLLSAAESEGRHAVAPLVLTAILLGRC